jgi:hypothetical protein
MTRKPPHKKIPLHLPRDTADALKTQGEPVAWMATCMGPIYAREVFRIRKEAEECGDAWDHCHVTPLYTAPPTAQSEPVATVTEYAGSLNDMRVVVWREGYSPEIGTKLYTAPPADDRPTWEEVRHMLVRGYADGYEDHQCDISGNPGSRADRIIAEFRTNVR